MLILTVVIVWRLYSVAKSLVRKNPSYTIIILVILSFSQQLKTKERVLQLIDLSI